MKCIDRTTGIEIKVGDMITSFRGNVDEVTGIWEPGTSQGGKNGKISVESGTYYVSVFNGAFIDD